VAELEPWERILLAKLADLIEEEARQENETTAEVIPLPQPEPAKGPCDE
jgi:hypothetical protein